MDAWRYAKHAAISENSIVVLGDSITAFAPFPDRICGFPLVSAGWGGAGTDDALVLSRGVLAGTNPRMVIVAFGVNDVRAPNLIEDYQALLVQIADYTDNIVAVSNTSNPNVIASERKAAELVGVPFHQIEVTGLMSDNLHFNADGYRRQWIPRIADIVCRQT